jgi:hypothetical protein
MVRGWYERIQDMRGLADVQSILTLASILTVVGRPASGLF